VRVKYKLIKNTVANYGLGLWNMVITFILMALIINGLGPIEGLGREEYGIYLLIAALVGYFSLFDMGIGQSLVKFIAEYHAKGEKEKVNEVVNTAFFIFLGIGAVGSVGLFILGSFVIDYLKFADADQLFKARALTYILAIAFSTSFSMAVFKGVLRGMQKFVLLAYIAFASSLINVCVTVWVLWMGFGVIELVLYTVTSSFFGPIAVSWFAKRELPYLEIKRSFINRKIIRSLFGLSMLLLLLFIFNKIVFYTDNLVIGWWFVGTGMVTIYVAAHQLYSIPSRAINNALQAMMPAASELDAKEKRLALQLLLTKVSKYCLALLFMLSLPTIFMSEHILNYWLGDEYGAYFLVANILIISIFFDYFNNVSSQILIGMNKIKFLVAGYGVVALLNLVLSVILVQSMGLEGVALGTAIPFIIMAPVLMWNAFKIIGINWKEYAKSVYVKTIPFAFVMGAVLYFLMAFHVPTNLIEIALYYVISMGVFLWLFYNKGLDEEERNDLKSIFSTLTYRSGGEDG
jgi:O-antigen/teichoic acid export membrane protein